MEKMTITEIKQQLQQVEVEAKLLEQLQLDERKGAQLALKQYGKKQEKRKELKQQYQNMSIFEQTARQNGKKYIAGMDEAGRGPLAGPVVAAAVILPVDFELLGLNDSKQLNKKDREAFFEILKNAAVSYGIGIVNNNEIDEINIYEATKLAMRRAVSKLEPQPEHLLIDAMELAGLPCTSQAIIKGDSNSVSIAAASILAKVTRDNMMEEISEQYPAYDFASNMGYGTKKHMEALVEHGPTVHHRLTFAPVRNAIK